MAPTDVAPSEACAVSAAPPPSHFGPVRCVVSAAKCDSSCSAIAVTSSRKLKVRSSKIGWRPSVLGQRTEEGNGCVPVLREFLNSSFEFALQISPLERRPISVNGGGDRLLLGQNPPNSRNMPFGFGVAQMPGIPDGRKASTRRRGAQRQLRQTRQQGSQTQWRRRQSISS